MSDHYIGEFVLYRPARVGRGESVAMILSIKNSNSPRWSSEIDYQHVYYVLTNSGNVEGPLFSSELLSVSKVHAG
jgi:hypothetical protein